MKEAAGAYSSLLKSHPAIDNSGPVPSVEPWIKKNDLKCSVFSGCSGVEGHFYADTRRHGIIYMKSFNDIYMYIEQNNIYISIYYIVHI